MRSRPRTAPLLNNPLPVLVPRTEAQGLTSGFGTSTVDAGAPTTWKLTEGTADLPGEQTYRATMGIQGEQSNVVAAVFDPDDVRARVRPGEVFYLPADDQPGRVAPAAEFEAHVRAGC